MVYVHTPHGEYDLHNLFFFFFFQTDIARGYMYSSLYSRCVLLQSFRVLDLWERFLSSLRILPLMNYCLVYPRILYFIFRFITACVYMVEGVGSNILHGQRFLIVVLFLFSNFSFIPNWNRNLLISNFWFLSQIIWKLMMKHNKWKKNQKLNKTFGSSIETNVSQKQWPRDYIEPNFGTSILASNVLLIRYPWFGVVKLGSLIMRLFSLQQRLPKSGWK